MRHAWGLDRDTDVDVGTGVLELCCSSPLTTMDKGGLPQLLFWSLITLSATKQGLIWNQERAGPLSFDILRASMQVLRSLGGTHLRVDFDVLLVQSELLHILDSRIVFTQVLWLLLLQLVFGGREVLLRLLHNIVCGVRVVWLAHRHGWWTH